MKSLVINKNDLVHNINVLKKETQALENYKIIAVVKGNGYGLDLVKYSELLIDNGIDTLAVSTVEEAVKLREAGIKEDILMLSSTSIKEELELLIEKNIIITIGSEDALQIAKQIANEGKRIRAHIAIDTGFGRYGFLHNDNRIVETIKEAKKYINIEGIFSQFSLSYYKDNAWTKRQFERFQNVIQKLEEADIKISLYHICNSSGFLNYPNMRLNSARLGSAFLGRVAGENTLGLKRIGKLKTRISEIKTVPKGFNIGYLNIFKTKRETKIAIIPIGYMDGYNLGTKTDMFRTVDKLRDIKHTVLRKNLEVVINEKRYKVLGKVGMYHIVLDITGSNLKIGDEVYLDVNPIHVDSSVRREYI